MPVPYLAGALKGWTKKTTVKIVTQVIVNHKKVPTTTTEILNINFQPVPQEKVNRKPEEQRSWKWWSIIIKNPPITLKPNDKIITATGRTYKVESDTDWTASGFSKNEAIEDFT